MNILYFILSLSFISCTSINSKQVETSAIRDHNELKKEIIEGQNSSAPKTVRIRTKLKSSKTKIKKQLCSLALKHCSKNHQFALLMPPTFAPKEEIVLRTATKSVKRGDEYIVAPDNYYITIKTLDAQAEFFCTKIENNKKGHLVSFEKTCEGY